MRYSKHIFICQNQREPDDPRGCCLQKGGAEVHAKFKAALKERGLRGAMRANKAGCLDACQYGVTVVVYPDCIWYGGVTVNDVDEIIDSHLINDRPVERLLIPDRRYTPPELFMSGGAPDDADELPERAD